MRRIFAMLLVSMLLFTACDAEPTVSETDETTSASVTDAVTTTETEQEETLKVPELPALNMDGKKFTILTSGWARYAPLNIIDIAAAEINGEALNDAAYKRIQTVNEKYSVKITEENFEHQTHAVNALDKSVAAGEDQYQLAIMRSYNYAALLTGGRLADLGTVPHLDLSAPYHNQASLEALSLGGKNYGVVSDLSVHTYYTIFCTYFNKQLMEDHKLGSIYDIIRAGDWTVDKMHELGAAVAADLDNSGTYDARDAYAFTYINDVLEGFIGAGGIKYAELDKSGGIVLTYENENAVNAFMELFDSLSDQAKSFNVHTRSLNSQEASVNEVGMFMKRQSMFSLAGIYYAPQFREMEDDFGIIPMPKLTEGQKEYYSPMFSSVIPITVVPITNAQLSEAGIIWEEMAYQGRLNLYPALFDTLLKGKIARDSDSIEMLDMIFSNTTYDTGAIFNFGKLRDEMRNMYKDGNNGFASYFASVRSKVQGEVDTLMKKISS